MHPKTLPGHPVHNKRSSSPTPPLYHWCKNRVLIELLKNDLFIVFRERSDVSEWENDEFLEVKSGTVVYNHLYVSARRSSSYSFEPRLAESASAFTPYSCENAAITATTPTAQTVSFRTNVLISRGAQKQHRSPLSQLSIKQIMGTAFVLFWRMQNNQVHRQGKQARLFVLQCVVEVTGRAIVSTQWQAYFNPTQEIH